MAIRSRPTLTPGTTGDRWRTWPSVTGPRFQRSTSSGLRAGKASVHQRAEEPTGDGEPGIAPALGRGDETRPGTVAGEGKPHPEDQATEEHADHVRWLDGEVGLAERREHARADRGDADGQEQELEDGEVAQPKRAEDELVPRGADPLEQRSEADTDPEGERQVHESLP